MKRNAYLITVFVGLALALGVVGGAMAQSGGPAPQEGVGVQAALGTGFTYQGQLKSSGSSVNGTCIFGFGLWDSSSGGVQLGVTQTVTTTVANGLFTVTLNDAAQFGGSAFSGSNARYLGIGVKCGSESNLTNLGRQTLTASPYALYARNNWGLNGNSTSASNFLGTTNNMTLTLAVSNTAALRLVPNATSPNLIGGWSGNSVSAGVVGATIGGGGAAGGYTNTVSGNYGTVGGGWSNAASSTYATVAGGSGNLASGLYATVGGGQANTADDLYATVGGGLINTASGANATIGGGVINTASGDYATISGGQSNAANSDYATVGGGTGNSATNTDATVGGGQFNTASGQNATVGGGLSNTAGNTSATVGGGWGNFAGGSYATVPGGTGNIATGQASFAAGQNAQAVHDGAFVWADYSTISAIASTTDNQFLVRASGGITLYTDSGVSVGAVLPAGSGTWSSVSDRSLKANFASVDGLDILEQLVALPIETWNYQTQNVSIRHIGPMAQDFYAAFNVGEDNTHISTVDADGVALAAIQGLYQVVQEKDTQISTLRNENADQQQQINDLQARLSQLEQSANAIYSPPSPLPLGWLLFSGLVLVNLGFLIGWNIKKGVRP